MGNPGSSGPAGAVGPQGPTGGVLSFAKADPVTLIQLQGSPVSVTTIVLQNVGTYVLGGQLLLYNSDSSGGTTIGCYAQVAGQYIPGTPYSFQTIGPSGAGTVPLAGYYVNSSTPTTLNVVCTNNGPSTSAQAEEVTFTAIQVQ